SASATDSLSFYVSSRTCDQLLDAKLTLPGSAADDLFLGLAHATGWGGVAPTKREVALRELSSVSLQCIANTSNGDDPGRRLGIPLSASDTTSLYGDLFGSPASAPPYSVKVDLSVSTCNALLAQTVQLPPSAADDVFLGLVAAGIGGGVQATR